MAVGNPSALAAPWLRPPHLVILRETGYQPGRTRNARGAGWEGGLCVCNFWGLPRTITILYK